MKTFIHISAGYLAFSFGIEQVFSHLSVETAVSTVGTKGLTPMLHRAK